MVHRLVQCKMEMRSHCEVFQGAYAPFFWCVLLRAPGILKDQRAQRAFAWHVALACSLQASDIAYAARKPSREATALVA